LKQSFVGVGAVVLVAWVLTAQNPAGPVIDSALQALGSHDLKTMQFSGSGAEFCLGQQYSSTSGWPKFNLADYTRVINFDGPASRQTAKRSQSQPMSGGCGSPVADSNQQSFIAANAPWAQKLEILLTPQGFLKYAAGHNPALVTRKVGKQAYNVVSFKEGKYTMNGYIDAKTNLLDRVETWLENPLQGDMLVEAKFSDYKDFSGLKFPAHLVQSRGGFPVLDLAITDAKANVEANLQPPAPKGGGKGGAQKKGGPGGPPAPPTTEIQKLGDGVYLLTGAYQSVAVEFKNYVAIWEASSEARAAEVIAKVRETIPNKPIRYAIFSHSHSDHTSGVGTLVAEGITIIAHRNNKPFFDSALAAPRTLLEGDKMAASGKKPKFEWVGDKKVLSDGKQVVELYLVKGNIHDNGNLMMYLPKLKILVESDVYNYTAPNDYVHPWHANFLENVERLKLDVDRVIPTHAPPMGRVVTMADVRASVKK